MKFSLSRRAAFSGSVLCVLFLSGAVSIATPAFAQEQNNEAAVAAATSSGDFEAVIVSARGKEVNLSVGAQDGVLTGAVYAVERDGKVRARLRVTAVRATESSAVLLDADEDGDAVAIGDMVRLLSAGTASSGQAPNGPIPLDAPAANGASASTREPPSSPSTERSAENIAPPYDAPMLAQAAPQTGEDTAASANASGNASGAASEKTSKNNSVAAQADQGFALVGEEGEEEVGPSQRRNRALDYAAVALAAALALGADDSPSDSFGRSVIATDQFSVISPFPGGGYTIRPDGIIAPGGAMQVNIPLAYAPRRRTSTIGVFVAQSRSGRNPFGEEIDRNGTLNFGLGFGVRGRGVWLSRMVLSSVGFGGGDSSYNALVQVVSETKSVPAIAVGIQDIKNQSERSPFVVATKQLATRRPVYLSLGIGAGRFAGSRVFGGVSYAPAKRLSLSAEYDGIQINLGTVFSVSRRLSVLLSANDLSESDNRPGGALGRRFQLGTTYRF